MSVLISLLLNCIVIHGYLPNDLMSTVIVPIVKNKTGNITGMDNYRPIAITTVFSKVIELLLLYRYSDLLCTTDNQFGFRTDRTFY